MPEFKGKNLERSEFPPIQLTRWEGLLVGMIVSAAAFVLTGLWVLEGVIV